MTEKTADTSRPQVDDDRTTTGDKRLNVYVVFSGTTDHRYRLFQFLHGNVSGFTALQSAGCWQGIILGGDVLVFFDKSDADKAVDFLLNQCGQQSAPMFSLNATEVSPKCA